MANVDIELTLQGGAVEGDGRRYDPASTVQGWARLTPDGTVNCRRVLARLEWHTEGRGDRDVECVDEVELASGSLVGTLVQGFTLAVPQQPWSYAGDLIKICWRVIVVVDVPFGHDITAEEPIVVAWWRALPGRGESSQAGGVQELGYEQPGAAVRGHHRAQHDGEFRIPRLGRGRFRFRFRRADGRLLPDHVDPAALSDTETPVEGDYADIPAEAATTRWIGDRLDRHYAISVLAQHRKQPAHRARQTAAETRAQAWPKSGMTASSSRRSSSTTSEEKPVVRMARFSCRTRAFSL
jgi:hypothetical protein